MDTRGFSSFLLVIFIFATGLCLFPGASMGADNWTRVGKTEVYGLFAYTGDDSVRAYNPAYRDLRESGTLVNDIDPGYRGGIGIGYTLYDYININGTLWYGQSKLFTKSNKGDGFVVSPEPHRVTVREIEARLNMYSINLNADLYLYKDVFPHTNLHITPMVTGGVGVTHHRGDWPGGDLNINEYDLCTNVGIGLRWDFGNFMTKVLYTADWVRLIDTRDSFQQMGYKAMFGYVF